MVFSSLYTLPACFRHERHEVVYRYQPGIFAHGIPDEVMIGIVEIIPEPPGGKYYQTVWRLLHFSSSSDRLPGSLKSIISSTSEIIANHRHHNAA